MGLIPTIITIRAMEQVLAMSLSSETANEPGSQYEINTGEEFHIRVDFNQDASDVVLCLY